MSHASLKEQLQALASQLPGNAAKDSSSKPSHTKPTNKGQKSKIQSHQKPIKQPKPKWLEHAQYGVELLKAYFPECFKSPNEVKPLKKGIKQDLIKKLTTMNEVVTNDKACMVKSLSYYVNTISYHKSVIEGIPRIDLDGQPAGVVSADEANYSIERCQAKLKKKQPTAVKPLETETA